MTATAATKLLRTLVAKLAAADIVFMVVGSFASSVHGVPRTTQDLDVVIDPSVAALRGFMASLDPDEYYVDLDVALDALERRSMFNVIDMRTGWKVDFVIRKDRAFSIDELDRRLSAVIAGVEVPTATAEDTIIAKLEPAKDAGAETLGGEHRGVGGGGDISTHDRFRTTG